MKITDKHDLHARIATLFAHQEYLGATDFDNPYIHLLLHDLFEIYCDQQHRNPRELRIGAIRRFVQLELAHYAEHAAIWRDHGITMQDLKLALRQFNEMLYRVRCCPTVSEASESCGYIDVTYTIHNPRYLWFNFDTGDYVIVSHK